MNLDLENQMLHLGLWIWSEWCAIYFLGGGGVSEVSGGGGGGVGLEVLCRAQQEWQLCGNQGASAACRVL